MKRHNKIIFGIIMVLALAAAITAAVYHWFASEALIPAIILIVVTAVAALANFFFVGIEPTEETEEGEKLATKQAVRRYIVTLIAEIIAIILLFLGGYVENEEKEKDVYPNPETTTISSEMPLKEESTTQAQSEQPLKEETTTQVQQQPQSTQVQKPQSTQTQKPTQVQQQPQSTQVQKPQSTQVQKPQSTQAQKPQSTQTQKPTQAQTTKPVQSTTTHTHSYEVLRKVTDYQRLNDTQHILITYSGDQVCSGCGHEVAGKYTNTPENHSFDSSGKCSCGYKKVEQPTTPPTTEAPKKAFAFVSLRGGKVQETSSLSVSSTETVSIKLTNAEADDLKIYWTDPETGERTSRGVELVSQGGGKYQVITSDELHQCSVQIVFVLDGQSYILTCMPSYE